MFGYIRKLNEKRDKNSNEFEDNSIIKTGTKQDKFKFIINNFNDNNKYFSKSLFINLNPKFFFFENIIRIKLILYDSFKNHSNQFK